MVIFLTSHLIRRFFTEQTRRLDAQHNNQNHEGKRIGERGIADAFDKLFAKTDDECADDRARNRADAAEDCRDERLQTRHTAGGNGDVGVVREVKQRANGSQERADDEREGNDGVDLDAHQLRRLKVLGRSAHRHTDFRLLGQPHENQHQQNGQHRRDERDALGLRAEDGDHVGNPGDGVGNRLRKTAGQVERKVLDEIAHADGGDHQRHSRCRAQRLIRSTLNDEAEQRRQHQHQRNRQIHRQRRGRIDHNQSCDHEDITVGKVNQTQNTIDQRVADGNECVLTACGNAVDDVGEQPLHSSEPPD